LLGGNLGELGLLILPALAGVPSPLNTRQILAVNLLSDVLPALMVTLERPQQRRLNLYAREGGARTDALLHKEIFTRGLATALPSLAAFGVAARLGTPAEAATAAFAALVSTQLSQTLVLELSNPSRNWMVLGAIAASLSLLGATLFLPWVRTIFMLGSPSGMVLPLTAVAALAAPAVNWLAASLIQGTLPRPVQLAPSPTLSMAT
jgi:magnesium-transporting ATPase (P-type)